MQQKRKWLTLTVGVTYAVIAMLVMLYAVKHREVMIEDGRNEQMLSEMTEGINKKENNSWKNLKLSEDQMLEKELVIPLGQGIKTENLVLENDYINKELWIRIEEMQEIEFLGKIIARNLANIKTAVYGTQGNAICVKLELDGIYECRSILEGNYLYIDLMEPKEAYDRVLVIDPYGVEEDTKSSKKDRKEQEITLDIAKRIGRKLSSDSSIKVFYTRTDEEALALEERKQIIAETEADLYIGIALNETTDSTVYGVETVYNGTYFIPFFGNTELADCVEKNVTQQVLGRANGLTQMTEEDIILQRIQIPAVVLKAGYVSNEKEAELLNTEEYRDRIAEGIVLAVQEAYEKMENETE